MPDALKVVHVVLSLDVGGLERIVLDLVRQGQALGQQVEVLCLERPGVLAPQVEDLGAPVHCVSKRPGIRLGTVGRLKTLLQGLGPDVVHTHQIGALFYAGPAARRALVPVIVHTEHGKHYGRRRTRWLGWLAGRSAARFFCVSQDIAAEVLAGRVVPRRKLRVVPNGIDPLRFNAVAGAERLREDLGIPPGAPVVGTVGRLTEVKCQDVLLRAFTRVRRLLPQAHLLLVGDGPLRAELDRLTEELGLSGQVHFAGYQVQPERYLPLMDVFALTSRSEGMPLVVLEAWAAGLPVVASRVGGLPEMIADGQTGVLFPAGDEEALGAALGRLLTEPSLARSLGAAGRQRVNAEFSLRRMAETYRRHYLELLSRQGTLSGRGSPDTHVRC